MNYYQPTYTRVSQAVFIEQLTQRLGPYQRALEHALELEVISDGDYRKNATLIMHAHTKQDREAAVLHSVEILDMLEIGTPSDFYEHRAIIREWFSHAVYQSGKEYVLSAGIWFERVWQLIKMKKPKKSHATIYSKDFHTGQADDAGLSLCVDDGTGTIPLKHGRAMERLSKRVRAEQAKFTRPIRARNCGSQEAEKLRSYSLKIHEQYMRDRTVHVNDCVKEILTVSRFIVYCGPTTPNDARYYHGMGMCELVEFFKLISVMTRSDAEPVVFTDYDTRMLRSTYDNYKNGHEAIAQMITAGVKKVVTGAGKL